MRNNQLSHYYKMVTWNSQPYQESTYYLANGSTVIEFMNWRILFPPGYQQGSQKYPTIVMLHGAGESGREWSGHFAYESSDPRYDNNDNNLLWGGQEHLKAVTSPSSPQRSFPGIVVFPQVSYSGVWSTPDWNNGVLNDNGRMVTGIIEYLIKNFSADPYRIYVHGLSGGAKGVWEVASKRPDLFSAMLPMSGVGTDINAMTDVLVTMPVWLFQGGQDTNPSPGYSTQWINALKNKGGSPRYTIYPDLDHGTWNTAYQEPDFFSWMLQQDKRKIYVFSDNTSLENQSSIKLGFSDGFLSYQWLLDGTPIPGATTRYYTATSAGKYTVRFQRRIDGVVDESFPTQITAGKQNALTGLTFNYYEFDGNFPGLSSYDFSQAPTATGNINNFYIYTKRNNQFALSYDGIAQIDKPGPYRFYLESSDGSLLYINGAQVVSNDGAHELRIVSNTYNFPSAGKYPIRVLYFDQNSPPALSVLYNEGMTNNFSLANMFLDTKLFLPGQNNSSARYSSMAAYSSSNQKIDPDVYDYYKQQITVDTTQVNVLAFPNPFKSNIHLTFYKELGQLPASLYDLTTGRQIWSQVVDSAEGEVIVEIPDNLNSGFYVLRIGKATFKLFKRN